MHLPAPGCRISLVNWRSGDFADALALDQHVDSAKAVRLLGWQPRHGGFLDEVEVFYRAWTRSALNER